MRLTSYQCGLLQAKAYRLLRSAAAASLEPYQLSVAEWSVLVQLQGAGGMRHSHIATALQVEAPLVTALVKQLERKRLVRRSSDPQDSRAKRLFLTRKGAQMIPHLEDAVRGTVEEMFDGISDERLLAYFSVMEAIVAKGAPDDTVWPQNTKEPAE
jgi:DNA-binding MarR family transcriptional regulator